VTAPRRHPLRGLPLLRGEPREEFLTAALLNDVQHGLCNLLPSGEFLPGHDLKLGLRPGPERDAEELRFAKARTRRVVIDKQTIPTDCPLRQNDWTLTIAGGN